jgi:hypothetical protein
LKVNYASAKLVVKIAHEEKGLHLYRYL